jgi:hypothetical protein
LQFSVQEESKEIDDATRHTSDWSQYQAIAPRLLYPLIGPGTVPIINICTQYTLKQSENEPVTERDTQAGDQPTAKTLQK